MNWLFGSKKTPAEMLKQHQRSLNKAVRELDRERTKLEQQEKTIIVDMKKTAKAGQINAVKVMAKDLVRTRNYIKKFYAMRTQLQAVGLRIQTMRSNQSMAQAMSGVTKAMRTMNKQMNLPQISKIMQEFEKENEMMDMKEEVINDAIDDAMEEGDEEEETEMTVNQILDEIGIDVKQSLADAPQGKLGHASIASKNAQAAQAATADGTADDDLAARLSQLRKD